MKPENLKKVEEIKDYLQIARDEAKRLDFYHKPLENSQEEGIVQRTLVSLYANIRKAEELINVIYYSER